MKRRKNKKGNKQPTNRLNHHLNCWCKHRHIRTGITHFFPEYIFHHFFHTKLLVSMSGVCVRIFARLISHIAEIEQSLVTLILVVSFCRCSVIFIIYVIVIRLFSFRENNVSGYVIYFYINKTRANRAVEVVFRAIKLIAMNVCHVKMRTPIAQHANLPNILITYSSEIWKKIKARIKIIFFFFTRHPIDKIMTCFDNIRLRVWLDFKKRVTTIDKQCQSFARR